MSSRMQGFEPDVLTAVLNGRWLLGVHIVTNALLMIAFFYWTQIPEETGWQFTLTVVCGLAIGFVALWLHSATFVYFGQMTERGFRSALRAAIPRIPAFLIWAFMFGLVGWLLGRLWEFDQQAGGYARHLLPLFLRRTITPRMMISVTHGLVWFLYFFVWPILFLPFGAQVAAKNVGGFFSAAAFRPIRELRFWLAYLVCFLAGAYLPYRLAWMVPRTSSPLSVQEWSMALRLGFGYLLLVTSWVVLCEAIVRASGGDGTVARDPEPAPVPAC